MNLEWTSEGNSEKAEILGGAISLLVFFDDGWKCAINRKTLPYMSFAQIADAKKHVVGHFHDLLLAYLMQDKELAKIQVLIRKEDARRLGIR